MKRSVKIITNKGYLTLEGLKQIFSLKSILNHGLSDNLKSVFPDLVSVVRPIYTLSLIPLHPLWISGFVTAERSFHVSVRKLRKLRKLRNLNLINQVFPIFSIGLHIRDKLLLVKIP